MFVVRHVVPTNVPNPMKPYIVLSMLVVGIGFFGLSKVQAEELYFDGYPSTFTTSTNPCLNGKYTNGGIQVCDGVWPTGTMDLFLEQDLYIPASDWGFTAISKIVVKQQTISAGGSGNTTLTLVLLDETKTGVATSSENFTGGGVTRNIPFVFAAPYEVTEANQVTGFRLYANFAFPNDPGPIFRLSQDFSPNNLGFTNAYDLKQGTYPSFSSASQHDTYDLWYKVYIDDPITLSFTHPDNNTTVNDYPFVMTGTCYADFDLTVYQGTSIASSTQSFGQSVVCPGSFTWSVGLTLDQGYWNAYASSTVSTAGIVFQYLAQSQEITPNPTFDNNPFAPQQGGDLGFWGYLYDWGINKGTLRPYSYIPQVGLTMYDALTNPTSTDWLQSIPINYRTGTFNMPGITSSLFDTIPTDYKGNLRTISTIAFSASFIAYIWHLRKRLHG